MKSVKFEIPIICVGNITVGGTGKTPHTEYLISMLKERYNIAVLSRGYKRKTKGFRIADENSGADEIGDEPAQIKRKFPDITVAVSEKRVKGIRKVMENNTDIDFILLDDAFQHRYVKPGLSIVLMDYNAMPYDDKFLPYGRLRDSVSQLHRAEILIITKVPNNAKPIDLRIISNKIGMYPYQKLFFSGLKYGALLPVFKDCKLLLDKDICKKKSYTILVVTAIANPKPFIDHIQEFAGKTTILSFPDHHNFTKEDDEKITTTFNGLQENVKIIVTTEKDSLRFIACDFLNREIRENLFYIPISVSFVRDDETAFENQILKYTESDILKIRKGKKKQQVNERKVNQ